MHFNLEKSKFFQKSIKCQICLCSHYEWSNKYFILILARKHGLDVHGVHVEVLNLISHATQERLRDIVEKLATIAEHRIEIYKVRLLCA